ncbi:MAG: hypothetical protein IJ901_11875 [Bacteroidaceae bacterium]|nr:hypothetical protein [Bacteroidaceae bacterium]
MRYFQSLLLLFAATVLTTKVQAQVINGDLNHNQGLDVEDVTLLIDGYLTGEAEVYTPKIDFYQEDNSMISGIWWLTNDSFLWFKEDGTFYGLEYKFFPSQGRVVLFKEGVVSGSFDVVYLTDEVMVRRNADGTHETFTRTQPEKYEAVDLGLSVKWATMNVGANSPEEYGDYFAWGETSPKDTYSWETYKWCKGSQYTLTKYCSNSSYGTVDNKTVLDPEDDAAQANWGGTWRMPTDEEYEELVDNCTWIWTTLNGVNGYNVTGSNGNSIFLPAAGKRSYDSLSTDGSRGNYWSSSLYGDERDANYLYFISRSTDWCSVYRRIWGLSVRAVCP